ncbi:FKBP-type peptidyl-prolyl cis-trans isomerase [Saprospira sp. CCB-QB6]|uniref:FKBP-type peptidyl-prolyl cis-trans isomerase n=1 Tax=Saprospira sp. CCB-QB6 TaxID=3023936 RepID=UPI002349EC35|nr:FKBP-type peptidyl-prolyl cis-trans isomerase [Saprospira sp. CCB-QB6]WCL82012.1 FKBP-type peptidyl-prolyl cis-trans isomerase [Saprospira sp. CCB-QB6]
MKWTTRLLFAAGLFSASYGLQSCGEPAQAAPMPSVVSQESAPKGDNFSYAYGMLLGSNLKAMGMDYNDVDTKELLAGLQAALEGKGEAMMDQAAAQQLVNKTFQDMQAKAGQANLVKGQEFLAENAKRPEVKVTESGLQYEVLKEGVGGKPSISNKVKVHYHGTLIDGTVFDSSVDRGQPISFPLGNVIRGWQEGLQLMPVGAKYKLYIPADLGYGGRAAGKIPANSALIFEVELLAIE